MFFFLKDPENLLIFFFTFSFVFGMLGLLYSLVLMDLCLEQFCTVKEWRSQWSYSEM